MMNLYWIAEIIVLSIKYLITLESSVFWFHLLVMLINIMISDKENA